MNITHYLDEFIAADVARRSKALAHFQSSILPTLTQSHLETLLSDDNFDNNQMRFSHVIVQAICDEKSSENCREKALDILVCSCRHFLDNNEKIGANRSKNNAPRNSDVTSQIDRSNLDKIIEKNTFSTRYNSSNKDKVLNRLYILACSLITKRLKESSDSVMNEDIRSHFKNYQYAEKSEEIRLRLVQLVLLLASNLPIANSYNADTAPESFEKDIVLATSNVCSILSKSTLYDGYPELIRESCALLQCLAIRFPQVICKFGKALLSPIIGCKIDDTSAEKIISYNSKYILLRHRHSKCRFIALELSAKLVMSYAQFQKLSLVHEVVGAWKLYPLFDHSIQIRQLLTAIAGGLLITLLDRERPKTLLDINEATDLQEDSLQQLCVEELFTLLLYLCADEVPLVADQAFDEINNVILMLPSIVRDHRYSPLDNKFESSSIGPDMSRESRISNISSILMVASSDTSELQRCLRSIQALSIFITICIDNEMKLSETDVLVIVDFLCVSVFDRDRDLINACTSCASALGKNLNNGITALNHIMLAMEKMRDCRSLLSLRELASKLCISANIIEGIHTKPSYATELELKRFCLGLCSSVIEILPLDGIYSSKELAASLLKFFQVISSVDTVEQELDFYITISCIILLGYPDAFGIKSAVNDLLCEVSRGKVDNLYRKHFQALINYLSLPLRNESQNLVGFWSIGDPYLNSFDALVRTSGPAVISDYFDLIIPVIEHHLYTLKLRSGEKMEWETMIFMMALLEYVLSSDCLSSHLLHKYFLHLIEMSIVPNLVWMTGGKASAMRKLASATLFSILKKDGKPTAILLSSMPCLLPVLKSNLDDDDSVTRELISMCLSYLFEALPSSLDEATTNELYPVLLKMLDDTSDSVRMAACRALKYFVHATESANMKGPISQYIVEYIITYMDDPDANIRVCIFEILCEMARIDGASLIRVLGQFRYSYDDNSCAEELYSKLRMIAEDN